MRLLIAAVVMMASMVARAEVPHTLADLHQLRCWTSPEQHDVACPVWDDGEPGVRDSGWLYLRTDNDDNSDSIVVHVGARYAGQISFMSAVEVGGVAAKFARGKYTPTRLARRFVPGEWLPTVPRSRFVKKDPGDLAITAYELEVDCGRTKIRRFGVGIDGTAFYFVAATEGRAVAFSVTGRSAAPLVYEPDCVPP